MLERMGMVLGGSHRFQSKIKAFIPQLKADLSATMSRHLGIEVPAKSKSRNEFRCRNPFFDVRSVIFRSLFVNVGM